MAEKEFRHYQGKGSLFLFLLGWVIFKCSGWHTKGVENIPSNPKAIGVFAPHTSMWDVFWMLSFMGYHRIRVNWLVKSESHTGLLGMILRRLGGVPVDRTRNTGLVQQVVEQIEKAEKMYLVLSPEGTRAKTDAWRTGFYYIALEAGLTVTMTYADYAKKEVGIGPTIKPSGNIEADMATIRAFYDGITPKYPELRSNCVVPPKIRSGAA